MASSINSAVIGGARDNLIQSSTKGKQNQSRPQQQPGSLDPSPLDSEGIFPSSSSDSRKGLITLTGKSSQGKCSLGTSLNDEGKRSTSLNDEGKRSSSLNDEGKRSHDEGKRRSSRRLKSKQKTNSRMKGLIRQGKVSTSVHPSPEDNYDDDGNGYQIEYHDQEDGQENELVQLIQSDSRPSDSTSYRSTNHSDLCSNPNLRSNPDHHRLPSTIIVESGGIVSKEDEEVVDPEAEEDLDEGNLPSTEDSSPLIESTESPPQLINSSLIKASLVSKSNGSEEEGNEEEEEEGNEEEEEGNEEEEEGNEEETPEEVEPSSIVSIITPKLEGQSWSKIIFARNNHNANGTSIKDSESSSSPASFTEWNRKKNGLKDCTSITGTTESEIMTLRREGDCYIMLY